MWSGIEGRQTVPREELTAINHVRQIAEESNRLKFRPDVTYTHEGLNNQQLRESKLVNGQN
eukprot:8792123-Karenia_brevis.AAC.1